MVHRELLKHQSDLIVERVEFPGCTSEHSEDSHHRVEKIWHNGDISENRMKIAERTRRKLSRETAKRPRETLKDLQEFCGKHWLCAACYHNLPYSSYVWTMGSSGRIEGFLFLFLFCFFKLRKTSQPSYILQKTCEVCQKHVGECDMV